MSPPVLAFLPTALDREFNLHLWPETLDALRFIPRADLESYSPVCFAIGGWERCEEGRDTW